ncbi:unnamed protein product, partial [Medioppia subpectinata]
MLTLVTSAKSARDKLPRVSYIHALDIWIIVCTIFIFASLVEYATVNFIYHKEKRRTNKSKANKKNNIQNSNGLKRTLSNNSVNSYCDSMYSTVNSDIFLQPPPSPLTQKRGSMIRTGSDGGIVPNLTPDHTLNRSRLTPKISKTNIFSPPNRKILPMKLTASVASYFPSAPIVGNQAITVRMSSTIHTINIDFDALTGDEVDTDCDDSCNASNAEGMKISDKVMVTLEAKEVMINSCKDKAGTDGQICDPKSKCESKSTNGTTTDTQTKSIRKSRVFDYNLINKRTGVRMFDKKSLALIDRLADEVESIVRFVCFHCEKRYHSMHDYKRHHSKRHFKDGKAMNGIKYRKIVKKQDNDTNHKTKHKKTKHLSSSISSSASLDSNVTTKIEKINVIQNQELTATYASKSITPSTSSSVDSESGIEKTGIRFVPQCQICSFAPLVDSMNMIEMHIKTEHKKSAQEVRNYYAFVHFKYKSKLKSH